MTKADFIAAVTNKTNLNKKDSADAVNAFIDCVTDALVKGEDVTFVGFGSFKVKTRAGRKVKNPQTGEEMDVPASKTVAFKPGKNLKDAIKATGKTGKTDKKTKKK